MSQDTPKTEQRVDRAQWIDQLPIDAATGVMLANQAEAIDALQNAVADMARAIRAIADRLRGDDAGRLIYVGAGTSARVGVQDGAELLPTFAFPAARVDFVIAGGPEALMRPVENAEDSADAAATQIAALNIGAGDCVVGLAASGNTPFTCHAIELARTAGALTVGIANNADTRLLSVAEIGILLDTGAEAVAGSTRLKAATAQKICLNILSTGAMCALGHVRNGLMVSMEPRNAKLRDRHRIIRETLATDGGG